MKQLLLFLLTVSVLSCQDEPAPRETKISVPDSTAYYRKKLPLKKLAHDLDTFFSPKFRSGNFSGTVLVAMHGVPVYEKIYGWENKEKRDSLTDSSSFQLASVSKQFTAAAVIYLAQEGKLKLEDSVRKFFPGLNMPGITVHHLLCHRGGLEKYTNLCDNYYREKGMEPPASFNNDSVVQFFIREKVRPLRAPDIKYDYSNTGFVLLASIVEKVSGKRFQEFMQDVFFRPLQMNSTWVAGDGLVHEHMARGYYRNWVRWDDGFLDNVTGDKGVYSNARDLLKWDRSLRRGEIISYEWQSKAYSAFSKELVGKKKWNYGYGWRTVHYEDGYTSVFHNGWWHGYTTTFYRGLTEDVTIVILCNKFNRGIYNLQPVLKILGVHHYPDEESESESQDPSSGGNR